MYEKWLQLVKYIYSFFSKRGISNKGTANLILVKGEKIGFHWDFLLKSKKWSQKIFEWMFFVTKKSEDIAAIKRNVLDLFVRAKLEISSGV